jgi:transcription antitermination factor NusG
MAGWNDGKGAKSQHPTKKNSPNELRSRGQSEAIHYMEEKHNEATMVSDQKRWCILRHPDADLIGEIFSGKRKVQNLSDDSYYPLPPFEHFIPFADLKKRPVERMATPDDEYKSYDAMLDERALRNDLHHYIFICQPKEVVLQILDAPWNKVLRHRLFAYRDENGIPIEISNTEMERFKTILKRYDFQIVNGEPSDEVCEGDMVAIISGPMEGSEGQVQEIRERDGQVTLTVAFSMFQDKMRIAVPGISIADVRLRTPDAQQLLHDPVIGHFEDELIELLCHLHGKKGSKALNKDDHKRLKFLYQYSDIVFEDNPENCAKFAALMLICVYLMNDKEAIKQRTREVEALLTRGDKDSTELDCYLMTALFIVKHDPGLRRVTKVWRQCHPDCSLVIRRLQSIAKHIRC